MVSDAQREIPAVGSTDNAGNSVNLGSGIIHLPTGFLCLHQRPMIDSIYHPLRRGSLRLNLHVDSRKWCCCFLAFSYDVPVLHHTKICLNQYFEFECSFLPATKMHSLLKTQGVRFIKIHTVHFFIFSFFFFCLF